MTKNTDMTSIFTLTIQKLEKTTDSFWKCDFKFSLFQEDLICLSTYLLSKSSNHHWRCFFFLLFAKNIVLEKYTRKNLTMSYLAVSLSRGNVPLIFMLWNWLWKLWNAGEHWLEMSWTLFLKLGVLLNLQQCRISSIYVNKNGNLLIIENVKGHIISMN